MANLDDASPTEIGLRIRNARKARRWSQGELAEAVGVSRSAVAQWETGRAGQVTGNLNKVANALEMQVEELMLGITKHASLQPGTGDEGALLRLYRKCSPGDRQLLLHVAKRLAYAQRAA